MVRAVDVLHAGGDELVARLWDGLSAIKAVRCYGPPPGRPRTPTISFTVVGIPSAQVARSLVNEGIFASNGNFYATGVLKSLGIGAEGLVRAGCACYTSEEEVDRLIEGVRLAASGKASAS